MSVNSVAARRAQSVQSSSRANLPEPYGQFHEAIMTASRKYNLAPEVLFGILKQESGGRVNITGYDGHGQGPWQIDDRFHAAFLRGNSNGRDINSATDYAAKLLRSNIDALGGDVWAGVAAYNAGVGGVQSALRAGRSPDSATTGNNYSATIRRNAEEFRRYLGGEAGAPGSTPGATPSSTPGNNNTSGTTAPSTPPSSTSSSNTAPGSDYLIQRGDTLWAIASRLKANGMDGSHWEIINRIVAMNPQIKDPNLIYTGDTLKLPAAVGASNSNYTPSPTLPNPVELNPTDETSKVEERDPAKRSNVPYINQYRPDGAERGYGNGPANCGPASAAMIARSFGYGKGMTDAQLINHLGAVAGTNANGTGVNGIALMAQQMGKQGVVKGPGANTDWMVEQLKAGKMVVANGDLYAMPPHQNEARTSGHYVTVYGVDNNGNFLVHDPADQNVKTVTAEQMRHFINSNPNGGWQISIG